MTRRSLALSLAIAAMFTGSGAFAQPTAPPPTLDAAGASTAAPAPADAPAKPPLKAEELEALLAPIALYPDSLLSQMFMASTYPLEVVEADRWAKSHTDLKGDALAKELEKQTWDPSVRSLVNFPTVLSSMSEKLDTTIKLGDAFIAQQGDVMNTVQVLRSKANKNGNLKSTDQQKIVVEAAPPATQQTTVIVQQTTPPPQIIKIESPSPQTIYVPTYEPTVVYGSWPYPAYPPYPYYPPRPPGYVATAAISFGVGVACGAAWGYAWGGCNWGRNDVDIDINRNANFNSNINRNNFNNFNGGNRTNIQGGNRTNLQGGNNAFKHDPAHRQGVPYRDKSTAQKFGGANQSAQAAKAREQYRGRADQGRQNLSRDAASGQLKDFQGNGGNRPGANGGGVDRAGNRAGGDRTGGDRPGGDRASNGPNRDGAGAQNRAGTADRSGSQNRAGAQDRAGTQNRSSPSRDTGTRSGAFSGVDRGGSGARTDSNRGSSSRSASPSRSSGGGGGSRSSGGGARSGGGGGRSGGGGGRGRSDVNLKENFTPVDPQATLIKVADLPITTWNYKDETSANHLGPMAQDFYRAFGIGTDDKTITYLDEGGVALSAIQGLNQKLNEKDARIAALEKELADLKAIVQKLAEKAADPQPAK